MHMCTYVRNSTLFPGQHMHMHSNSAEWKSLMLFAHRETSAKMSSLHITNPVCNDHSRDQAIVVPVDRRSLYGGVSVQLKYTMNQPTVVSTDRWSVCRWSVRFTVITTPKFQQHSCLHQGTTQYISRL